jgi:hypothetical protein
MTTIACNLDGMACDKQATHSSGYKFKLKTKVFEVFQPLIYPKPFLVGYAGNVDQVGDVLEFLDDPTSMKPPRAKGCEFIVLTEDKKIFTFVNVAKWILLDEKHYAIGSGSPFALGAMKAGASPKQAVKVAMESDPNTGFGVKEFKFR